MENILFDLGLSYLFSYLREAAHNLERRRKIRNVCLKVARKIFEVFGEDEDFQNLVK